MLNTILSRLKEDAVNLQNEFRNMAQKMNEATGAEKINLATQLHYLTAVHLRVQDAISNLIAVLNFKQM